LAYKLLKKECHGFSYDWCGIEDDDDNETRQKKWDDYKSKFPKLTLKEQFDVTS
jgi:predicted PolB exonuclease-like 3'-5' exonuclease